MTHDEDTMSDIFSGRIKIAKRQPVLIEQGHGIGIGHVGGSYELYAKQLREKINVGNGAIYIGKNVSIDTSSSDCPSDDSISIIDPTTEFTIGDVPKVLIMFHNLINQLDIKVTWQEKASDDIILASGYIIPSPYSMRYDWWDLYSVYFIAPENLEEGKYQVTLEATDRYNTSTSIIDFTMKS